MKNTLKYYVMMKILLAISSLVLGTRVSHLESAKKFHSIFESVNRVSIPNANNSHKN